MIGRMSPAQMAVLGKFYGRTLFVIAIGPVAILFNVPKRFEKPDPPYRRPRSLDEIQRGHYGDPD